MKYLYRILIIVAALTFLAGVNFSTSSAQVVNKNSISADAYTLSGRVTNTLNQPISKAKVTVLNSSSMMQPKTVNSDSIFATATTNTNGKFKVENMPRGKYTVKVKADNFQTSKKQVTVTKDKSITIVLKLAQDRNK